MEVLDTTIANVVLPYRRRNGSERGWTSWVVTTYLVANAIILTTSSFLAKRLGRRTFFLICLALFTISSWMCGVAWSLQSMLLFRVLQGFAGGGMVPIAQFDLADAFPPEKRGPGLRPVRCRGGGGSRGRADSPAGGWRDDLSWRWCFLINVPVGLLNDGGDCDGAARAGRCRHGAPGMAAASGRLRPGRLRAWSRCS